MRNLIECNNVIPNIIVITNETQIEQVISSRSELRSIPETHITRIFPEKEELTVEQIKELGQMTRLSSTQASLISIVGLDFSSGEVQNMLLKSLEELTDRFEFLIFVYHPDRLLPTIKSRCTLINLHKPAPLVIKKNISLSEFFSFTTNSDIARELAIQKIDDYLAHAILNDMSTTKHILRIRSLIENNNVDPAMGLDSILLFSLKHSTIKDIHETKK